MNTPTCRRCATDRYLKFTSYTPGSTRQIPIRTAQSTLYRTKTDHPIAEFFCQKCGHQDGHSVPDNWEVPAGADVVEELKAQGSYWSAPNMHHVLQEDGWVIQVGGR